MQVHALPASALHERNVHLEGPEAKHIVKVLRRGVGDEVVFGDGDGRFVYTVIERAEPGELHARIERIEDDPRERGAPWATLALALLKGDHFELALEKCVELGIHEFQPLLADHCVVKWKASGGERKLARWRKIAEAAMKQSGRTWRPRVAEPCSVEELVARADDRRIVVGDEELAEPDVRSLELAARAPFVAVVGPEGAFSAREKELLDDAGATKVSLSPYILRAGTAAVALIAALGPRRAEIGS